MLSGQPRNTLENRPLRHPVLSVSLLERCTAVHLLMLHTFTYSFDSISDSSVISLSTATEIEGCQFDDGAQLFTLALTKFRDKKTRQVTAGQTWSSNGAKTRLANHQFGKASGIFSFLNISSLSVFYPDVTNQLNKRMKLDCSGFTVIYFLFKKENWIKNISFLNILWIYFLI